jgi:pimeloyl-ACP methyl ester carboxylesterase
VRLGLLALVAMPFVAWLMFRTQGLPPDTWSQTATVSIDDTDQYLQFAAGSTARVERVVILPGCPVHASAYAPLARGLAAQGITTFVVKIPYLCAPLPSHLATLRQTVHMVQATCTSCAWTIVGHSRGARHALEIVGARPEQFSRLVLLGSTHPRERDYSNLPIPVMKTVATHDGVAPLSASEANRRLLPASLRWEVIEGGNHSQFAYYGFQLFDGRATISREEQHALVIAASRSFVDATR